MFPMCLFYFVYKDILYDFIYQNLNRYLFLNQFSVFFGPDGVFDDGDSDA